MTHRGRRAHLLGLFSVLLAAGGLASSCKGEPPRGATLAIAASLRGVTPELTRAFTAAHPGAAITATFGASGDLRRQVEAGAPIDGVIFASGAPVDDLAKKGLADGASRKVLATNTLVLVGPKGARPVTFATLGSLPAGEKIAIGDPGAVPAGQYARDYLKALGVWSAVEARLVLGGDVSAVLAYARRGEVAAAVVYRTEARGIADIAILDEASGPAAPRAEVVAAVIPSGKGAAEARAFIELAASPEGRRIFDAAGFGPP